ncbi:Fe-Mn family superoxide dismutase [Sodalis-like secondary symbiont of Drepanosiphum platanoidis]|uniref:Fe-Mn family superoxide dismutase n=1 Tax=Sodalis-like secondary symbiont of Drepanosiphum platanoidis TaxID=2994493 RepID=UPI003463A883
MHFQLPSLTYRYDYLEPYIDSITMEIHHKKYHQTYIDNTNLIINNYLKLNTLDIKNIIKNFDKIPINKKNILSYNIGGHINHTIFWKSLNRNTLMSANLKNSIEKQFNSIDKFKKIFENTAKNFLGSGWVWLVKNFDGNLSIISTINQDSPVIQYFYSNIKNIPIFGIDLWEHAFYLQYKNKKFEYIKNFWNVIDWTQASIRFEQSYIIDI